MTIMENTQFYAIHLYISSPLYSDVSLPFRSIVLKNHYSIERTLLCNLYASLMPTHLYLQARTLRTASKTTFVMFVHLNATASKQQTCTNTNVLSEWEPLKGNPYIRKRTWTGQHQQQLFAWVTRARLATDLVDFLCRCS